MAGGGAGGCRAHGPAAQPQSEWQQQCGDEEAEDPWAGNGEDADHPADDDAGHGAHDEQAGQRSSQLPGSPVAKEGAGAGHDVVQQVRRCHRRTGHAQGADLDG